MMPEPDKEFGEFAAFSEIAPLLGFMYRQYGEEQLRDLLELYAGDPKANRELLVDAAAELQRAGLIAPAMIVIEFASDLPSGLALNPYDEADRNNWERYRQSWCRRRSRKTGKPLTDPLLKNAKKRR